jgi:hypothetical protein
VGPRADLDASEKKQVHCTCWYSNHDHPDSSVVTKPNMLPFLCAVYTPENLTCFICSCVLFMDISVILMAYEDVKFVYCK